VLTLTFYAQKEAFKKEEAIKTGTWHFQQYQRYQKLEYAYNSSLLSTSLTTIGLAVLNSFTDIDRYFWFIVGTLSLVSVAIQKQAGEWNLPYRSSNHLQVALRMSRLISHESKVNRETYKTVEDVCLRPGRDLEPEPEENDLSVASKGNPKGNLSSNKPFFITVTEMLFVDMFQKNTDQQKDDDAEDTLIEKVLTLRRKHTLAYVRYTKFQSILVASIVLFTLTTGVLAFLGSANASFSSDCTKLYFAWSICVFTILSIVLEIMSKKLKYGVRADMHLRTSLGLKRLYDKIYFANKWSDEYERRQNELVYNICFEPYEHVVPKVINEAFSALRNLKKEESGNSNLDDQKQIIALARLEMFYSISSYRWFPWFVKFDTEQTAKDALDAAKGLDVEVYTISS
jgi:hypothetical protein